MNTDNYDITNLKSRRFELWEKVNYMKDKHPKVAATVTTNSKDTNYRQRPQHAVPAVKLVETFSRTKLTYVFT